MKVLVTGNNGFVGKNLIKILSADKRIDEILVYNRKNYLEELRMKCTRADAVFHLAACLRPTKIKEFEDNINLTEQLISCLKESNNKCPVMFSSSVQAELNNPYGNCKRQEELKLISYGKSNNANVYIFRFPNLFGEMSKPNYTSVVATFCYNTVKNLPIVVNDPSVIVNFAFVENVLNKVVNVVLNNEPILDNKILKFDNCYQVGLGELAYYMQILKRGECPKIRRSDDFYFELKRTYEWYCENYKLFE